MQKHTFGSDEFATVDCMTLSAVADDLPRFIKLWRDAGEPCDQLERLVSRVTAVLDIRDGLYPEHSCYECATPLPVDGDRPTDWVCSVCHGVVFHNHFAESAPDWTDEQCPGDNRTIYPFFR